MTALKESTPLDAVVIGPTGLPEKTLGWSLLAWTADYLKQPDGDNAGSPWKFTREQARFLLWWYAVNEHGRFVYRNGVLRRLKGWGRARTRSARCCVRSNCAPRSASTAGTLRAIRSGGRLRRRG
ncbi:hypothetical protein [Saccharopolyspora taberi]|uniref:Uncharacterized protein n=1 Tax=Saccharopolyspora taberi TaxID=60895 RepID=A0ABN3VLJ7_9PSEU